MVVVVFSYSIYGVKAVSWWYSWLISFNYMCPGPVVDHRFIHSCISRLWFIHSCINCHWLYHQLPSLACYWTGCVVDFVVLVVVSYKSAHGVLKYIACPFFYIYTPVGLGFILYGLHWWLLDNLVVFGSKSMWIIWSCLKLNNSFPLYAGLAPRYRYEVPRAIWTGITINEKSESLALDLSTCFPLMNHCLFELWNTQL